MKLKVNNDYEKLQANIKKKGWKLKFVIHFDLNFSI
jgi:hypothetical protein